MVLILLWVEYGLGVYKDQVTLILNTVLILLWVEYGLGGIENYDPKENYRLKS